MSWLNAFLDRELTARQLDDLLGDAGLYVWSVERPGVLNAAVVAGRVEGAPDDSGTLRVAIPTAERVHVPATVGAVPPAGTMVAVALAGAGAQLYAPDGTSPAANGTSRVRARAGTVGQLCGPAELGLGAGTGVQALPPHATPGTPVARVLPRGSAEEILNVDLRDELTRSRGLWGLAQDIRHRIGAGPAADVPPPVPGRPAQPRLTVLAAGWTAAAVVLPARAGDVPRLERHRATLAGLRADGAAGHALLIAGYEYGVRLSAHRLPSGGPVTAVLGGPAVGSLVQLDGLPVGLTPQPVDDGAAAAAVLVLAAAPTDIAVDGNRCLRAVRRAAQLLAPDAGDALDGAAVAQGPRHTRRVCDLDLTTVTATTGLDLTMAQCAALLDRIDVETRDHGDGRATVALPPSRVDLRGCTDLAAELVRLHGYRNVRPTVPVDPVRPGTDRRQRRGNAVRQAIHATGSQEVVTPAVTDLAAGTPPGETADPAPAGAEPVLRLEAAEGGGTKAVRASLVPGLLATIAAQPEQPCSRTLFEIGRIMRPGRDGSAVHEADLLAVARAATADWQADFWAVHAVVRAGLHALGITELHTEPADGPCWRAGTGAHLLTGGQIVGRIGLAAQELRVATARQPVRCVAAEVDLARLIDRVTEPAGATLPSRFPTVQRDVNLVTPGGVSAAQILAAVRGAGPLLRSAEIVDVYHDPRLAQRVLTVRLVLASPWRTLDRQEAADATERIVAAAQQAGAHRR